jgi:protein-tyrosine phosphatase
MVPLIDIHCHLLPSLDDGAETMDAARKMLCAAQDDGIQAICLTPHYHPERGYTSDGAEDAYAELLKLAEAEFPDISLYLGSEIYYHSKISSSLQDGKCRPMNRTKHLLLEFSTSVEPSYLISSLVAARSKGYIPILAHVERYDCILRDFTVAIRIVESGFKLQMNADAILGKLGRKVKRLCHRLLSRRLIAAVASDAHDPQYRPPQLAECYHFVSKKHGLAYAQQLFCETPAQILGID